MSLLFLDLDHNKVGKDWVCGDLHGTYDELMDSLSLCEFNFDLDRLFCVGDLHDKGPHSLDCLKLLVQTWFYTVDCNHNELVCDYLDGQVDRETMEADGAQWFLDKPRREQERIALVLRALPACIRIGKNTKARVNIFHAEYLGSDEDLDESKPLVVDSLEVGALDSVRWGRVLTTQIEESKEKSFPCSHSLSPSFVGHTPVIFPFDYQNHVYMDCGTWNHSNAARKKGDPPLNFPLVCLSTGIWHHCQVDEQTAAYTKALADRIAGVLL